MTEGTAQAETIIFEDRDFRYVAASQFLNKLYPLVDAIEGRGFIAAIKRPFRIRQFGKLVVQRPNNPEPDAIFDQTYEREFTPLSPKELAHKVATN